MCSYLKQHVHYTIMLAGVRCIRSGMMKLVSTHFAAHEENNVVPMPPGKRLAVGGSNSSLRYGKSMD